MCTRLAAEWFPHRMPIDIHPRKLSYTNRSLDDLWEEHHSVIPIVPFPGGQKRIVEISLLEVPDEIILADDVPVRFRDFHTNSIVFNRIAPSDGIMV